MHLSAEATPRNGENICKLMAVSWYTLEVMSSHLRPRGKLGRKIQLCFLPQSFKAKLGQGITLRRDSWSFHIKQAPPTTKIPADWFIRHKLHIKKTEIHNIFAGAASCHVLCPSENEATFLKKDLTLMSWRLCRLGGGGGEWALQDKEIGSKRCSTLWVMELRPCARSWCYLPRKIYLKLQPSKSSCYFLFSSIGSGFLYHQGCVLLCDRKEESPQTGVTANCITRPMYSTTSPLFSRLSANMGPREQNVWSKIGGS